MSITYYHLPFLRYKKVFDYENCIYPRYIECAVEVIYTGISPECICMVSENHSAKAAM